MQTAVVVMVAMLCAMAVTASRVGFCPSKCICQIIHTRLCIECVVTDPDELKLILDSLSDRELAVHKLYLDSDNTLSLGPRFLGNMTVDKVSRFIFTPSPRTVALIDELFFRCT